MFRLNQLYIVFLLLFLLTKTGFSQVSQGGFPLQLKALKSSRNLVVEMPPFSNEMTLKNSELNESGENQLKPFRFAHPFEVQLNTENSGQWFVSETGENCWQLTIRTSGAKSINLIFDQFKLPAGSRLFVFNENKILGAFTDFNNKSGGKFAIAPIEGDEVTIQYEVHDKDKNQKAFEITRVNHDYVGIIKSGIRRPLNKIAGSCNIDVNCEIADDWSEVKNSVCRLIVNGIEVCTGALLNNTSENQKPYVISAAHCYDNWNLAQTSVYVFNYESPFCAPLDGDPYNSVSGAVMKASFDSLDFALVELSVVPPPDYRPYYAGWDISTKMPDSTACIHHPQGDIKKIALDYNSPSISDFRTDYLEDGFLKISRWDGGVTEAGSSGAPLFNSNKKIIGTLTGGVATCLDPVRDYFERFALSWNYKSDSAKQLKYWLDPLKSGKSMLNGNQFNVDENRCGAFTNLTDLDTYSNVPIVNSGQFSGYWGGSNSYGVTEFVEHFSVPGNEQLSGVSFGVGKIKTTGTNNQSEITVKVYNGSNLPESLIYSEKIKIKNLVANAMNFIGFSEIVEPKDSFFIGFELSNVQPADTFVIYQSLRKSYEINTLYVKKDNVWMPFNDANASGKSMANIVELVACNIGEISTDTPLVNNPMEILLYPNPTKSVFVLEAGKQILENNIQVYNLIGQEIEVKFTKRTSRKMEINLDGNIPGVYLVRLNHGNGFVTRKISFVPW